MRIHQPVLLHSGLSAYKEYSNNTDLNYRSNSDTFVAVEVLVFVLALVLAEVIEAVAVVAVVGFVAAGAGEGVGALRTVALMLVCSVLASLGVVEIQRLCCMNLCYCAA